MAQAENHTVKVNVEPVFDDIKDAIHRAIVIPEPTQPERPASELRLEALRLALRAHEQGDYDGHRTVVGLANMYADFVIDGKAAGE